MRFLQFCYNTQPSTKTCAFVLLFLTCMNVQFCKAYWWWTWSTEDNTEPPFTFATSSASPPPLDSCSKPEECARTCQDGEQPKTCCYEFVVEYYTAYGKACELCQPPTNDSRINLACECIISDGFEKTVFSINRMIPGPSIQVCRGDQIVIDVTNKAEGLEVTIHWHGIFQKGSQYYDGVPHVTQCPIISGTTFRYHFSANNSGTHFYHSHIAAHIIDGQHGSLIVRDPPKDNSHYELYDEDRPEHVIVVDDLFHELTLERFPGRYRLDRGQVADNFLINGRGKNWMDANGDNISLSTFIVNANKRYRFRVIDSCGTVCPIMLSIENHTMQVIATDGEDVTPVPANAINMASGERVDFVLTANQTPGQYWIYVRGLGECEPLGRYQLALLIYQGSSSPSSPQPKYSDLSTNINKTFNTLNSTECDSNICVYKTCKSDMSYDDKKLLSATADVFIRLSFDFFNYTSSTQSLRELFETKPDYKPFFVAIEGSHLISRINNYSYENPPGSLISQNADYKILCGNNNTPATCTEPCICTHIITIALGSLVEVMIYDKNPLPELNHPFHLHGYNFCVMRSGQFDNVTDEQISEEDITNVMQAHNKSVTKGDYKCCAPKDTIIVPNAGYVIFRFYANNPGWWFFHCHFSWHTASGMNLIFHVGTPSDLPPVPSNFPKCYNWYGS